AIVSQPYAAAEAAPTRRSGTMVAAASLAVLGAAALVTWVLSPDATEVLKPAKQPSMRGTRPPETTTTPWEASTQRPSLNTVQRRHSRHAHGLTEPSERRIDDGQTLAELYEPRTAIEIGLDDLPRMHICVDAARGTVRIPYHESRPGVSCQRKAFTINRLPGTVAGGQCTMMAPSWAEPVYVEVQYVEGKRRKIVGRTSYRMAEDVWVASRATAVPSFGRRLMVPIRFVVPPEPSDVRERSAEVTLVYEASEELVSVLPRTVGPVLSYELDMQRRIETGEPDSAVCGDVLAAPILNVCRTQSASIANVQVSYNATQPAAIFTLRKAGSVRARLFTLGGEPAGGSAHTALDAGQVSLPLGPNLKPGVYVLVLDAGGGDYTIHNVLVDKPL
ncbi:MAG: hypothetical protein MUC47_10210, partial [Candidatus Kapabacteria bacterium]|nr:hypothetical protein [Candidatus Kapabacteria bacterium]